MDGSSSQQGLAGGILIGLSATWLMATLGRISGIIGNLITVRPKGDSAWRLAFSLGVISGPILLILLGGGLGNVAGPSGGATGEVIGQPAGGVILMLIAGLLVGVGTSLGSGCTSGHGGSPPGNAVTAAQSRSRAPSANENQLLALLRLRRAPPGGDCHRPRRPHCIYGDVQLGSLSNSR